ncbi:NACHT domain-containing protein [Martelella sp. FOR1707]
MELAHLDRLVEVKVGEDKVIRHLSEFRDQPYLVLLGEPGAGKSSALKFEATSEGGSVVTCRELLNGLAKQGHSTFYLDALDEYRSDGSGKDKILKLSAEISKRNITRWRLTCRSEDWRENSDVMAMRHAANNQSIVEAHLLPLSDDEAITLLKSFGQSQPSQFLDQAYTRGADAFLRNPLSLRLLHSVVTKAEDWPTTRFELFEKATTQLTYEHDSDRAKDDDIPGVQEMRDASSTMCFYLLATGAKAFWHSNSMPTQAGLLGTNDLALDRTTVSAALDTALFRGERSVFQPMHKAVAEFLAARFLSAKVIGNNRTPAFPLGRAIALITSNDQKAPSELRGLYAWFAAHLQKSGDAFGANRLIRSDAATVLAYGDASVFDTENRRDILLNLDNDDPYFLASQDDSTVFGSLAGDDLAADFADILDSPVKSQLQYSVLRALADGGPVVRIQPKLREIVLDETRPVWMRKRAAEVFTSKSSDPQMASRELLNDLASREMTLNQAIVRADIMADIPPEEISSKELQLLLSDFDRLHSGPRSQSRAAETNGLTRLTIALKRSPQMALLDGRVGMNSTRRRHTSQVQSLLDQLFIAALNANPDINAVRWYSWLENLRANSWDVLDGEVITAIQRWIDRDLAHREVELFLTLNDSAPADEKEWFVSSNYITITGRQPTQLISSALIESAEKMRRGLRRRRLFRVAAYAAKGQDDWLEMRDSIVSLLRREGSNKKFIESLLSDSSAKWKKREAKENAARAVELEKSRTAFVADLVPHIDAIATADPKQFGVLHWGSLCYEESFVESQTTPLETITKYSDEKIAHAIVEGLVQFVTHGDIKLGIDKLAIAKANRKSFRQETVVAAGLHYALSTGRVSELSGCSNTTAIIGLKHSYFATSGRPSIVDWSVGQLASEPNGGSQAVVDYWIAGINAGADDLDCIYLLQDSDKTGFISLCIKRLFKAKLNLPVRALKQALNAAGHAMKLEDLIDIVQRFGDCQSEFGEEQQNIWNFVGLALLASKFSDELSPDEQFNALLAADEGLADTFESLCPEPDLLDLLRIERLGQVFAYDDNWKWLDTPSAAVRGAIHRLAASSSPSVGAQLKELAPSVDPSWRAEINHAAAEHARKLRDEQFCPPSLDQLRKALEGGAPANSSDLVAIVVEELQRYKSTLRTASETPWKRFWNTDQHGHATDPQVENEDRDRLLELLRPRFERYGIVGSFPEARRGENTRADILLLNGAGKNLPVEAKRHYNKELWTAPVDQLSGYASDENASGYGVYLVFWFGKDRSLPTRDDGAPPPETAEELEAMLIEDLPSALKNKFTIIVLDVAKPS